MSFVSNSLVTIATRVLIFFTAFGGGIINARMLGAEGVGILALLWLASEQAFRLGNLGFGSAFTFFLAQGRLPLKRVLQALWLNMAIMGTAMCLALLLFRPVAISPWRDLEVTLFLLALAAVPFIYLKNLYHRILSGQLRIVAMNLSIALEGIISVVAFVFFLIVFRWGLPGALLAQALANAVGALVAIAFVHLRPVAPKPVTGDLAEASLLEAIPPMWKYGRWNSGVMLFMQWVAEAPMVLLKLFTVDNALVGLYSRASNLGRHMRLAVEPIGHVLFPYTAASDPVDRARRTNALFRVVLTLMIPTMAVAFLTVEWFMVFLYGEEFRPAATYFRIMIPGFLIWPIGFYLTQHISASGNSRLAALTEGLSFLVAVPISAILIYFYGASGAAWSVVAVLWTQFLIRLTSYRKVSGAQPGDILVIRGDDLSLIRSKMMAMVARR